MKKLLLLAGLVLGLAAINARIEATRECGCQLECWCKQPGLRHFRWILPFSHKAIPPDLKREVERPQL